MTLIEMLIGITITMGVLMAALPVIERSVRTERGTRAVAASVGDARAFTEQVLRDLRPAFSTPKSLNPANQTTFTVDTYVRHTECGNSTPPAENVGPIQCRVTYACSGGNCTRQEGPLESTGGTAVRMIEGLSSNDVFVYDQIGDHLVPFVGLKVVFPNPTVSGDDAITLEDGTALRNLE